MLHLRTRRAAVAQRNDRDGARRAVPLLCATAVLCASCAASPDAGLEREIDRLETQYVQARKLESPEELVSEYLRLKREVSAFRASLDQRAEIVPRGRLYGRSSSSGRSHGGGLFHLERRDNSSVRVRADQLLRQLDRFLDIHCGEVALGGACGTS